MACQKALAQKLGIINDQVTAFVTASRQLASNGHTRNGNRAD